MGGVVEGAHRMAWMLRYGTIPTGKCVLHNCDNPACVNPAHLRLGTQADNAADRSERGRHGMWRHPDKAPRGERAGGVKLTWEKVQKIRELRASTGLSESKLGAQFGVCRATINYILRRKTWV